MIELSEMDIKKPGETVLVLIDEYLDAAVKPNTITLYGYQCERLTVSVRGRYRRETKARPDDMTCDEWIKSAPLAEDCSYHGIPIRRHILEKPRALAA